jgi:hypothetical protein
MEGSERPLIVIRKDWFKAETSDRVFGFLFGIILLLAIIAYLHISGNPDAWVHTGALVLFIIAGLIGIWTKMRIATASTFELYNNRAVQTDDWRRNIITVPLDENSKVVAVPYDESLLLSRDNVRNYLFWSERRNWILLSPRFGWTSSDLEELWEQFIEVLLDAKCQFNEGESLDRYLRERDRVTGSSKKGP